MKSDKPAKNIELALARAAASAFGRLGGSSKSQRKGDAARANGAKYTGKKKVKNKA